MKKDIIFLLILLFLFVISWTKNIPIFRVINGHHTHLFDNIFLLITSLGDGLIVCLILSLLYFRHPVWAIIGILGYAFSGILVVILKEIFSLPRPLAILTNVHVPGPAYKANSFPSGHSASAWILGIVISDYLLEIGKKWLSKIAIIIGIAVGYSRVYIGVHFPSDVLGGFILGELTYIFLLNRHMALYRRIKDTPFFYSKKGKMIFATILLFLSLYLAIDYNKTFKHFKELFFLIGIWLSFIAIGLLLQKDREYSL